MADDSSAALTGAAFDLANAGYTPMPEPAKKPDKDAIASDRASLRQAANRRPVPHDEAVVREYTDASGQPAAANEAVTLERASRDYARAVAADKTAMQEETRTEADQHVFASDDEAQTVDPDMAGRADSDSQDAKAGEAIPDRAQQKGTNENGEPDAAKLDPDLAKALEHPQVRLAIEEKIGEAERSRQSYVDGLAAARQIAHASFISQFPELANVAPEHLPGTLEQMSRQDPAKFARVQALVATTEHLAVQQQHESRRQTETAQQNFQRYAKSEDARLETMLKGEPPEVQRAVSVEIMASARESGVEEAELFRLFNSEPLMRNAVFQRMMYDAGKYRMMMRAKDAIAARPMPPVQRPGTARTSAERESTDLRTLNAKLSNSGDIKDAVALYHARKANRR
jgi:hypothetical protein